MAFKQLSILGRALLTLNVAGIIRAVRCGPIDATRRLSQSFFLVDPFGDPEAAGARAAFKSIPHVSLSEVLRTKPLIRVVGSYEHVDGSLTWGDIRSLISIAVDRAPKSVFEIGTFNGYTTRLLAANLPSATIHTIDLPEDLADVNSGSIPKDDIHLIQRRTVGAEYLADQAIGNVVQHFGDTATFDFASLGPVELFFIDGSHTYEYVRNDTLKALEIAAPGSTFLWHDCDPTHPGVVRWLAEMVSNGRKVRRIDGSNVAVMDL
jgi:hypothetical protein